MYISDNSKVLLLPKGFDLFKVVKLPIPRNTSTSKSFLINKDGTAIFEMNEIKGFETEENRPKLKGGDFVKSVIVEQGEIDGGVLQSSRMIVSNRFNPVFLFIAIMFKEELFTRRFITLEDIMDQFTSFSGDWITHLSNELVTDNLIQICETLDTNGEVFYKFSLDKSLNLINGRSRKLEEYLNNKGDELSIYQTLKHKLLNSARQLEQTVPPSILSLLIQQHSVDFICDTYLPEDFKPKLISFANYNFSDLATYLEMLKQDEKNLKTVENNMNSIVTSEKKKITKKVVPKSVKKKVAIGKGALDGFFKKA